VTEKQKAPLIQVVKKTIESSNSSDHSSPLSPVYKHKKSGRNLTPISRVSMFDDAPVRELKVNMK